LGLLLAGPKAGLATPGGVGVRWGGDAHNTDAEHRRHDCQTDLAQVLHI
jgi:hypothetical protein